MPIIPVDSSHQPPNWGIPLELASTNLRELLVSTLEPLVREAQQFDVELDFLVGKELPSEMVLDADKVAWAMATLVGSALRHSRRGTCRMPGGMIRVELESDSLTHGVTLSVRDEGRGIPEQKLRMLFARSADRPHVTGLSLKLIHQIAAAHGGKLEIESRTGAHDHGTSVTLRLPRLAVPSAVRNSSAAAPA